MSPKQLRGERSRFSLVALLFALPPALPAQVLSVDVSNDITWTAGASTIDDEGARRVTLPSTVSALDLGLGIPPAADVTGYQVLDDGRKLFTLDTFVDLGGGVLAGPEDVIAWNGTAYSLFFDGSAAGVPAGTQIDAVGRQRLAGVTYLLLSFDVPVSFPGVNADDEDVVAWNSMAWSMFFDGSANGVPAELDLDGFDRDPTNGTRYLSFDTSGKIASVDFDDEDVVAFDGINWSLAFDASGALGAPFAAGDLDALGVRTVNMFNDGFEIASAVEWSAQVP